MHVRNSPALLLFLTGGFLGLTFPLGKLASNASVSPVVWAWIISAGSGLVLLLIHTVAGKKISIRTEYLKYYLISSVFSLVIPNLLIFNVIPKLGSGFTGILFTLSPIFTLALSFVWQVQMPNKLGVAGILVGFLGAVIVTLTRGEMNQPAGLVWVLAGLSIPISLAAGNLFRTIAWPRGASPFELAIGSNLSAAILLFAVVAVISDLSAFQVLLSVKTLSFIQIFGSAAMFSVFFRLQQIGGPTYLSQIGYIAAGVALFSGTLFLGEMYSLVTWLGAIIIFIGIVFSIVAQKQLASQNMQN